MSTWSVTTSRSTPASSAVRARSSRPAQSPPNHPPKLGSPKLSASGRPSISDTLSDIVASMSSATDLPPDLHRPAFMPDLLVAALSKHADKPAVYLGDEVLT